MGTTSVGSPSELHQEMGYRDLLPVQEPCWTEEGGLTVQCKALAVLDAMLWAPEDGWLRGGNADNDDGVLCVHREGLLGRLVEDACSLRVMERVVRAWAERRCCCGSASGNALERGEAVQRGGQ